MLTCQQMTELVTAYVEGKLSLADRLRFLMHLSMCSKCRRYVRQLRATAAALGKVEPVPPTPDQREALLEQFRSWKK